MVFVLLLTSTVLGRAIAIIKELSANNRKTNNIGFNFAKIDFEVLNPFKELIFKVAACSFLFQICHPITIGIKRKSQKNSGFKKVTLFIVFVFFKFNRIDYAFRNLFCIFIAFFVENHHLLVTSVFFE